jgi:CheY-like chemotaxis protein
MLTSRRRILVIDDDPDTREVLELALSLEGYDIATAASVDVAMQILQQTRPNLILLDYHIDGVTPQAFLDSLRQRSGLPPVILISAEKDCARRARELGLMHYLPKPFELEVLLELIRRVEGAKPRQGLFHV